MPKISHQFSAPDEDKPSLRQLAATLRGTDKVGLAAASGEPLPIPTVALNAFAWLIECMLADDFVRIDPVDSLLTTQQAADYIGLSRPSLIKLLGDEDGQIPYARPAPGHSHRRVRLEDLIQFRERLATEAADRGRRQLEEGSAAFFGDEGSKTPPHPSSPPQMASDTALNAKVVTTVNGHRHEHDVEPRLLLVHYLRDVIGLTGTHVGCDTSQCGACTILVDGMAIKSCTMFAIQVQGKSLITIEGMAQGGQLHPLQQAFWDEHGLQCGYCTPGFIMAAAYLLETNPDPTEAEIRRGLEGNLCRCTGYMNIIKSVKSAAHAMRAAPASLGVRSGAVRTR